MGMGRLLGVSMNRVEQLALILSMKAPDLPGKPPLVGKSPGAAAKRCKARPSTAAGHSHAHETLTTMIASLATLLAFQLVGEAIRIASGLPVPGPVIGMILLFVVLVLRGGPGRDLSHTSGGLLQHLSLLFVPAGTGVMLHLQRLGDEWLATLVALVGSTLLGLAVSAAVFHFLAAKGRETEG